MDNTRSKLRDSASTLWCLEHNILPLALTLIVNSQVGSNIIPRVLLDVELCWGLSLISFEGDKVTDLRTCWWVDQLDHGSVSVLTAQNHSVRFITSEFLCLQVGQDDDHSVLHSFDGNKGLESRCDLTDLTIAHINFFTVELIGFRMLPNLNNFTNADIHL